MLTFYSFLLVNQPEAKDDKEEPQYLLPLMKDEDSGGGFSSLISKFIHYLLKVSIRNVKPNEHPDRKCPITKQIFPYC